MEDAQVRKPKTQTVADRVVGVFVPTVLVIDLLTVLSYLIKGSSLHIADMTGISVLVIACPCTLGLATPLAVPMGVKSGQYDDVEGSKHRMLDDDGDEP